MARQRKQEINQRRKRRKEVLKLRKKEGIAAKKK
jgi:hypothetical protein